MTDLSAESWFWALRTGIPVSGVSLSRSGQESAAGTEIFFWRLKNCLRGTNVLELCCSGASSLRMMKETQATRTIGPKTQNTVMPIRSLIVKSDAIQPKKGYEGGR